MAPPDIEVPPPVPPPQETGGAVSTSGDPPPSVEPPTKHPKRRKHASDGAAQVEPPASSSAPAHEASPVGDDTVSPTPDSGPTRVGRRDEPPPSPAHIEEPSPVPPSLPVRIGRMEIPRPAPIRVGRVDAPAPVRVDTPAPARVGRVEAPAQPPAAAPKRVGRAEPPAPPPPPPPAAPKRGGRADPPPQAPAPAPVRRVEVSDIEYREENIEAAQLDELYATALRQFEKLAPALEKCGLDSLGYYVNLECTTKDHFWQPIPEHYMWLDKDGTIGQWTSDCVHQYLDGASMPIGKTHPGQWTVEFKILRTFRPNPGGGTLCPYKGLAQ